LCKPAHSHEWDPPNYDSSHHRSGYGFCSIAESQAKPESLIVKSEITLYHDHQPSAISLGSDAKGLSRSLEQAFEAVMNGVAIPIHIHIKGPVRYPPGYRRMRESNVIRINTNCDMNFHWDLAFGCRFNSMYLNTVLEGGWTGKVPPVVITAMNATPIIGRSSIPRPRDQGRPKDRDDDVAECLGQL
jgi:hypothetical protein